MDFDFLVPEARDLCTRLLMKDPLQRLGSEPTDAEELKCHPWFEVIDWSKIENKLLVPPYKPQLDNMNDVKHFPPEFTNCVASPLDEKSLTGKDGNKFLNFSYTKEGE